MARAKRKNGGVTFPSPGPIMPARGLSSSAAGGRGTAMTIFERALDFVSDGDTVGLGSGRAATAFIEALGRRVGGGLKGRVVATSPGTAEVARRAGGPAAAPDAALPLSLAVDGADEVDPNLDLIKGYGRALVREKIVASSSRQLIILVGEEKLVARL